MRLRLKSPRARGVLVAVLCAVAACVRPRSPAVAPPWFTQHRFPAGGRTPFGVAVGDFNSDGRPDLAISLVGDSYVSLLLGTGGGQFVQGPTWPADVTSRGVVATDVNGDGHTDLVVAGLRSAVATVFLGDGKGGATRRDYAAGLAPFNVDVADLNGDGNPDIVVANESNIAALRGNGQVSVLWGDGRGSFAGPLTLQANSYPADAKIADLNGDGRPDIAVVNWMSSDISVFFGRGDQTFSAATSIPYGNAPAYSLVVADLNGDHLPDILTVDLGGLVHVFYNSGAGQFTAAAPLAAGAGARCVIAADLNGDGVPDVVTADTAAGTLTILLGKPGGGFAAPHPIMVGKAPRVVAAADLNGDGKLDLVVTHGADDDVSVLINNGIGE